MRKLVFMTVSLLVATSLPVFSTPFATGDVFAGGQDGKIRVFDSSGTLKQTLNANPSGEQTGMAFDSSGNLYATHFGSSTMSKWDNNGNLVSNPFVSNDVNSHNVSIVFDATGNMYIGQADGTRDIIKRDSTGTFLDRYDVSTSGRGSDWIDLAADQKTMFYTSEGRTVHRYDVSTDTQLANFATLPGGGNAFALRILSDGGVIVADRSNIKRLDATGAVIQTYDVIGEDFFFALNLDPDGSSFWSAGYTSGTVYNFSLASGSLLTSFDGSGPGGISGLAVFGEITDARPTPEGGSTILLSLIGLISTVSLRGVMLRR